MKNSLAVSREQRSPGVVSSNELYTLDEIKSRLKLTDSSLRSARRRGLQVMRFGKRRYIFGRDFIEFLSSQCMNR